MLIHLKFSLLVQLNAKVNGSRDIQLLHSFTIRGRTYGERIFIRSLLIRLRLSYAVEWVSR